MFFKGEQYEENCFECDGIMKYGLIKEASLLKNTHSCGCSFDENRYNCVICEEFDKCYKESE